MTEGLQWQQFVGVAMGLRAEWLHDAGLAAWVRTSAVTEALGGTKFLARLKSGRVVYSGARSVTLQDEARELTQAIAYAAGIAAEGVRCEEMLSLYAAGATAWDAIKSRVAKS